MFPTLVWLVLAIAAGGVAYAYKKTGDPFHPLVIMLPMFAFLYFWMPFRLQREGGLFDWIDPDQLIFVQSLNVLGILSFIFGCISGTSGMPRLWSLPAGFTGMIS